MDTHYYLKNRETTRTYCIAQETISISYITYNGKESEKEYIYIHVKGSTLTETAYPGQAPE